ncbi:aspartate/glutamate racemase family protein [Paenibacillus sp. MMO-58]|uniref:aspartate/glutamate racemase family protein n=1 Tax=Paenibacillus sp. MMO-58 TaxID=3081290 RepID=UPI003019B451
MKIGCLHAHYSNIEYIEASIGSKAELIHFVDPGLMMRMEEGFDHVKVKEKAADQIKWIAHSGVDAILVTCTSYIALLEEIETNLPLIKIDEPFFNEICKITQSQILLFTNPATVEGTMKRLMKFASSHGYQLPDIEVRVIENAFQLIMQGQKSEYADEVYKFIVKLLHSEQEKKIAVAQLSMVKAAERVAQEFNISISNPLAPLEGYVSSKERSN